MAKNYKIADLKETSRYTVTTIDNWDGSVKTEEMTGEELKNFTNAATHLYDITATEITGAPKTTQEDDNRAYCRRIANEIEAYAAGRMWRDADTGEEKEAGFEAVNDDDEQLSVSDYLADALDYEITIDSQLEYKSAKIWVTLGGPNVWIDTAEKAVKLAWGTDRAEYALDWGTCDEIDEYMQELYSCQKEA